RAFRRRHLRRQWFAAAGPLRNRALRRVHAGRLQILTEVGAPPLTARAATSPRRGSAVGPTRKSRDVRFRAAVRGIADIRRALIRGASIYKYPPSFRVSREGCSPTT